MKGTTTQDRLWTGSFLRICLVNLFIFVNFHALLPTFPFFVTYLGGDAVTIGLATALDERFGGVVPRTMDELTSLPGVGRKTANVVLGNAFDIPGFPVDTHVMRVTGRLRWRSDWRSAHPDPVKIEKEITSCFPPEEWTNLSHRLILFGRATCHARTPDCANCPLSDTCPSYAPPAGKSTSKR